MRICVIALTDPLQQRHKPRDKHCGTAGVKRCYDLKNFHALIYVINAITKYLQIYGIKSE